MTLQRGRDWPGRAGASRTVNVGRATAEQPLAWLLAAVVFFANALLTLSQGYWWLAVLECGTSLLAALSAAAVTTRAGGHSPSQSGASTDLGQLPR